MNKNTKILLIVCLCLVLSVSITLGVLFNHYAFNQGVPNTSTQNQVYVQNETSQSSWHKIASYSGGSSNDYEKHDFNSKKGSIKVTLTGLPQQNYGFNDLQIYVLKYYNNGGAITCVGNNSISWGETEAVQSKEGTLYINNPAKNYNMEIHPTNMETWTVTIWDYY